MEERSNAVKTPKSSLCLSLCVALMLLNGVATKAETFGTASNQFSIDFTSIGNAGNASHPVTGYGAVGYNYRIGTYAISQNQVNAAIASGLLGVTAGAWSGDQPAANMSWYESAAFVNWLNTSKGFAPAYNLTWSGSTWSMALWSVTDAGYDANNLYRNSLAKYVLPSNNEFYKAAYGKVDGSGYYVYPTASDAAPTAVPSGTEAGTAVFDQKSTLWPDYYQAAPSSVFRAGGLSSYGTMGQGGNIFQLQESAVDGVNDDATKYRTFSGGDWETGLGSIMSSSGVGGLPPDYEGTFIGFRVASVPEPSTYALFGLGALILLVACRRGRLPEAV